MLSRFSVSLCLCVSIFFPCCASISTEELKWVSDLVDQHDELLWLADSSVKKTEEGDSLHAADSWSEALFGKKYDEFERTLMSLLCLKMILENDYAHFTEGQSLSGKLDRESFYALHLKGKEIVKQSGMAETEILSAMQAALILGDMGKVPFARNRVLANGYMILATDHDDFIEEAIKQCPHLFPTFNKLSAKSKLLLQKSYGLAHFGHITHLEGGPEMYSKMKALDICKRYPFVLKFAYFMHLCDVSGALGHLTNKYSKALTQDTYKALNAVELSFEYLKWGTENEAYWAYLSYRSEWLGFDPFDLHYHLLTRLGASMRLFTPIEGKSLEKGFQMLTPADQQLALDYMISVKKATYIPAVFVNMVNGEFIGQNREERIANTVVIGLPFVADVLKYREKAMDDFLILNFNPIAGIVKKNPYLLLERKFHITKDGMVLLD